MSSKTSRRSLVISAAALPTLALPALATAAGDAEPDPIFAAIEACDDAIKAERDAWDVHDKAQHAFVDKYGSTTPDAFSKEVRAHFAAFDIEHDTKFATARTTTHKQISNLRGKLPDDAVAEFHRELNRQTTDYGKIVKTSEEAATAAGDDFDERLWDLVNTMPTTPAGLCAMMECLRNRQRILEALEGLGPEYTTALLETIASAATTWRVAAA
jgi:hypothetical protein